MIKRILFFLLAATLFGACSSSGKSTADTEKRVVFGNGGGFTGQYITYQLNSDGRVFTLLADSSKQLLKKLRKKQTREIFTQADKIKKTRPAFSQPYNMTWFIRYYSGNEVAEYKWGDPEMPVADEIRDFYTQLNAIVK